MQKDWFEYWNGRNETIHKHLYVSQENPKLKNIHWLEPIPGLQQKVCQVKSTIVPSSFKYLISRIRTKLDN